LKINRFKNLEVFAVLLLFGFLITACSSVNPEPIRFSEKPYFFDVGDKKSKLAKDANLITPDFLYNKENGYGWLIENLTSFHHNEWERSRDAFLIDGASSQKVEFRADLPAGEWWVAIWYEAGLEDSSTVQIYANGANITPELQAFTPGAEPRQDIQKMYRVVQQKVEVQENGLTLKISGKEDIVRLLGFSFIPEFEIEENPKLRQIHNKIQKAGNFDRNEELSPLIAELEELAQSGEVENYAAYWKLQLSLLSKAEKYFWYRGWSDRTDETGLGLFDHLHQSVMLFDAVLNYENTDNSPIYNRALWYRGRLLYWLWLERGTHLEKNAAERDLEKMLERHPDDELVRMYNGEKIDADEFDVIQQPENAPDWAFAQWEVTNRLKQIADWWVLEQQSETGEFGGKYGDDVEILRFWSPLILSGDSIVYQGWKKLADGVWNSSKIHKGYAKNPSDVEHSSEFISDTAPLMVLYNDDKEYEDRLAYSARYFRDLWTDFNDHGYRFFKSSWFSSTEIEMEPPKNRDVPYTTRAAKAVRYFAWKTQDKETLEALIEWADAWLHATQRTDKGKPVGIIPASVEFPSGAFNGEEPNWYTANMYWDYFEWSGGSAILDQFLYAWTLTGDDKYLEPFNKHLELIKEYSEDIKYDSNPFEIGSEGWASYKLGNSEGFWNVVGVWRLLTGNDAYDDLILSYGTNYIKFRLTGNEDYLVKGIQPYLETVRYNYPMLTSEAIHTDRIHIGPYRTREIEIVQAMITGYGIAESSSPYIAVSWENASRDLSFLVTASDSTSLELDAYSFSKNREEATMRIWQLAKGTYTLELASAGEVIELKNISVSEGGDRFKLIFPAQTLVELKITPESK